MQAPFFLSECIFCCCFPPWTSTSSIFQQGLTGATLQGASRPLASDWDYTIDSSCSEASGFLNWAVTGFSGSPPISSHYGTIQPQWLCKVIYFILCKKSILFYVCVCVCTYIHMYSIGSVPLKNPSTARCQWLTPVFLTTWETEIRRILAQGQPRKIVVKIPSPE
jgi:hypothetical protein